MPLNNQLKKYDEKLQENVDYALLDSKSRRTIVDTFKGEYKKRDIRKAINKSPVTQVNFLTTGSALMAFLTFLSAFIIVLDEYTILELAINVILAIIFATPYIIGFAVFTFIENIQYRRITAYGITVYHIIFVTINFCAGLAVGMGPFGVGLLPIVFIVFFISGAVNWKKYEELLIHRSKKQEEKS